MLKCKIVLFEICQIYVFFATHLLKISIVKVALEMTVFFFSEQLGQVLYTISHPVDETHLDAVRGPIELRGFHPSASRSGVRRSDAATFDKDKQICFMLMPRT